MPEAEVVVSLPYCASSAPSLSPEWHPFQLGLVYF